MSTPHEETGPHYDPAPDTTTKEMPSNKIIQAPRLLDLPLALRDDPACWGGWVLVGDEHRRHILGYVNEQGHVPPWAERQLRVEYKAVRMWKTRP